MDSKLNKNIRKVKRFFGLCEFKGCFHRSIAEIEIPVIGVKRELCSKHLKIFTEGSKVVEAEFVKGD